MSGPMALGANYRRLFAATTISNLGDGVSVIAYPWLASAVTRNPILIALVAAAGRLPWLLFTLPAGHHHRPQGSAASDDRGQRQSGRSHPVRRRRRTGRWRRAARPRRGRRRHGHAARALPRRARGHALSRGRRGAVRQQRPDLHAGGGRRRRPRTGQRADVLGRDRRQPVRRPAARQPAPGHRLRGAVLPRRRQLRRLGRARLRDHRRGGAASHRPGRADVTGGGGHVATGPRGGVPVAVGSRPVPADGDHPRRA